MIATISKLALLEHCGYWARGDVVCNDVPGRSAIQGNAFHAWAFNYWHGGRPVPLWTKWFTERAVHAARWLDARRDTPMLGEVAFALDHAKGTARVLGIDINRQYEAHGALPHELCGTADLVAFDGWTVTIYDWKSGQFVTDSVWPQMRGLGEAARLALGAEAVRLVVLHARVDEVRELTPGPDDLTTEADWIRNRVESIDDSWPNPGPHCDELYCSARANCGTYQLTKARTA